MNQVLIVDDESDIRGLLAEILEDEGYSALQASNVSGALVHLANIIPALVILDIWLEGSQMDGMGLLQIIKKDFPSVPVVMISGHGNIETAVQAIKLGAYDFIEKPFKSEKLTILVKRAIEAGLLIRENSVLKRQLFPQELVGSSKEIQKIRGTIKTFARTNSHTFIVGEPGTGKNTIAKIIHSTSQRSARALTVWHTAGKSHTELSLELFGGLSNSNAALVEQAQGGTLYIDEITNIPLQLQKQFLQMLQNECFINPGMNKEIKSNIRVIAASAFDPMQSIKNCKLDDRLYYKLNIVSIEIPPLREHREDIQLMAEHFLSSLCKQFSIRGLAISDEAYSIMLAYNWPGNSRELHNAIEWLIMLAINGRKDIISHDMLPYEIVSSVSGRYRGINASANIFLTKSLREARDIFEREYIQAQLQKFNGNIAKTASFIGMDRAALHRKIKALLSNE